MSEQRRDDEDHNDGDAPASEQPEAGPAGPPTPEIGTPAGPELPEVGTPAGPELAPGPEIPEPVAAPGPEVPGEPTPGETQPEGPLSDDSSADDSSADDSSVDDSDGAGPNADDSSVDDSDGAGPNADDSSVDDSGADPTGNATPWDEADAGGAGPEAPAGGRSARRRITPATAVVAVLLALLGFTLVWQLRSVSDDPTLAAARQEDLVRILADLDSHEARLREDIADLEETRRRLTTAGESQQEALAEASRRADELGILAGTLPATGPGLVVEIFAGAEPIRAPTLLNAVQELRGAGAEAIQITDASGTEVRVVASTYLVDATTAADTPAIRADGRLLRSPYTIVAVGEPQTLQPALAIPGGVVESVEADDGTVTVQEEPDGVEVSAVREPPTLRYAQPVS